MTKCEHGHDRCGLCHDKSGALWQDAQRPVERLVMTESEEITRLKSELAKANDQAQQTAAELVRMRSFEADAKRYQYIKDNMVWHRYGVLSDPDSHALVGCKFPYLANFECAVMLDHNIDKMIESEVAQQAMNRG